MPIEYNFPCQECGQSFSIEIAQAGRQVSCPFCTEKLELPKLSEIKRLQPTQEDYVDDEPRQSMSLAQTWMFVVALPLILIGGGIAIWQFSSSWKDQALATELGETRNSNVPNVESRIDSLAAGEMWRLWHERVLELKPEMWAQSEILYLEQRSHASFLVGAICAGFAALGFVLLFIAMIPRRAAAR